MDKLSRQDLQILRCITTDARMTIKEISDKCQASRSSVNQRLQNLLDSDVIMSRGHIVRPLALGYRTCTFVGIRLDKGSLYTEVAERLKDMPEVVECHATTGRYTMIIKLYVTDNQDLMRILNKHIQTIPGVKETETLISLENSFERSIALPESYEKLINKK